MSKTKHLKITTYFGWLTICLEWLGAITLLLIKKPDLSEPLSQYGYYSSTKLVFGLMFTAVSIVYYLFARHLDKYWRYSSLCSLIAGLAFIATGWHSYTPNAGTFVLDIHNLALVISIFFFTLPIIGITYSKAHWALARFSKILYIIIMFVVLISLIVRSFDFGIIYAQFATLIIFHIWIFIVNKLLITHESELDKSKVF